MSLAFDDQAALGRVAWLLASQRVQVKFLRLDLMLKAGFDPSQPRVPAGNPNGGEWTDTGAGRWRLAQNTPRRPGSGSRPRSGLGEATTAQQAMLDSLRSQADAAVRRVQERDSRWQPPKSAYETIEGEILHHRARLEEANARYTELQRQGIYPGDYQFGSFPASPPGSRPPVEVRRGLDRIGQTYGCHSCGRTDSGLSSGHFIGDHQPPTAMNPLGLAQRLYPHCATCSARQGQWIMNYLRGQQ